MKSKKLLFLRSICAFLPPIVAQQVRERIMTISEAADLALPFKKRSFTGGFLLGNTKDFHAYRFYVHGYFDWRNIVLAKGILGIKPGDIIEVGANIGTETLSFAKLNPDYRVHAFEPVPANFKSLGIIKKENKLENLLLYNFLVSDKKGYAPFKFPDLRSSGSGYIAERQDKNTRELKVVTLDEELSTIQSCALLVTDVEGFDYKVVKGGQNIIKKHNPFLIIEVNANYLKERGNITIPGLLKGLEELGYKSFSIERTGLRAVDLQNFREKPNKNWLCIPEEHLKYEGGLSCKIFYNALNPLINYKIL